MAQTSMMNINPVTQTPARERGLKWHKLACVGVQRFGRSREGAWIEIDNTGYARQVPRCRSREGAWIEIMLW